jgi:hypothetical protein
VALRSVTQSVGVPAQFFEGRRESLAPANKLSRTYATLPEAFNRHRGKESAEGHGGACTFITGDRYRRQREAGVGCVEHAPSQTLPNPYPARDRVPVACNEER